MFQTVNILLTFSLVETVSSDQLGWSIGYGKYRFDSREYERILQFDSRGFVEIKQLKEENTNGADRVRPLHEKNVQLLANPEYKGKENIYKKNIHESSDSSVNLIQNKQLHDAINGNIPSSKARPRKINSYIVNFAQEKMGQRWPLGVIPYFIDKEIYDRSTVKRIVKQMGVIEMFSCIIFRELTRKPDGTDESWLYFTNPMRERECVHDFSTSLANGTEVVLGFDCLHPTEILHSLFHAIGFNDEVSHPHRDQYIRILWDNIQPKYRHLFRIRFDEAPYKLVEYDPTSIMHFHDRAFSVNGAPTITTLVPGLQISGNSQVLSELDVMKLKLTFDHECKNRFLHSWSNVPGLQINSNSQVLSQLDVMKLKLTFDHECKNRFLHSWSNVPGLQINSNSQVLSQLDVMKLKLTFDHECKKRKIGTLLDTCKNTLYADKKEDKLQSNKREPVDKINDEAPLDEREAHDDGKIPSKFRSIKYYKG